MGFKPNQQKLLKPFLTKFGHTDLNFYIDVTSSIKYLGMNKGVHNLLYLNTLH